MQFLLFLLQVLVPHLVKVPVLDPPLSRSQSWSQTKPGPGPWSRFRSRHLSGPSLGPGPGPGQNFWSLHTVPLIKKNSPENIVHYGVLVRL